MSTRSKAFLVLPFFSLVTTLILAVILLLLQRYRLAAFFDAIASTTEVGISGKTPAPIPVGGVIDQSTPIQQPHQQLTYEQSVAILEQEADVAAQSHQGHLTILAGDSLSLWFPADLLPQKQTWLKQAISGDTSNGLLRRLKLFDKTQPENIFVMIGINDLIRGVRDKTILNNQRLIIQYLWRVHPNSQIVVQSILPHSGEGSNWEEKRRLSVSNKRIRKLNLETKAIAAEEGVKYLDIHPLFTDAQGNLRPELSTDGLHLNIHGYLVWRSALQMYSHEGM